MTREEWLRRIRTACTDAGTYREEFDSVIETLAGIMEVRDAAEKQYQDNGGIPVIEYTNEGGHSNPKKNPALAIIFDSNQQALAYWRDLGLTPSGFKKLNEGKSEIKDTSFEKMLSGIGV